MIENIAILGTSQISTLLVKAPSTPSVPGKKSGGRGGEERGMISRRLAYCGPWIMWPYQYSTNLDSYNSKAPYLHLMWVWYGHLV